MTVFLNLHQAGSAIAGHLRRHIALNNIVAAPPLKDQPNNVESIRVSLMWVTPQPTHRNDYAHRRADGMLEPPPVSLSGFYLITCYGTDDAGEPIQAISRLGEVLQVVETHSILDLPFPDDPSTPEIDPAPGDGKMTLVHVPAAADLMEKLFTPLQVQHRPWALLEAGPIQLQRLVAPSVGPSLVRPGGARIDDVRPITRPQIARISPAPSRQGGRLRLDTQDAAAADRLRIGSEEYVITNTPTAANEIARPDAAGRIFVTYPLSSDSGDFDVVLGSADAYSEAAPVTIEAEGSPGVDAPIAPYAMGGALALTGGSLATAEEIILWPDQGVASPAEIVSTAPATTSDATLTAAGPDLVGAGLRPGRFRLAVRLTGGLYTPATLLEVTA